MFSVAKIWHDHEKSSPGDRVATPEQLELETRKIEVKYAFWDEQFPKILWLGFLLLLFLGGKVLKD